jgi:hypothetical protein
MPSYLAAPLTNTTGMAIAGSMMDFSPLRSTYDSGLFLEYAFSLQLAVSLRQRFGCCKNNGSGRINLPVSAE